MREFTITGFETAQCVATFLICLDGVLRVHRGDRVAATAAGLFLLICGAACYTLRTWSWNVKTSSHRNFHIYSLFALVLVLSGSRTLLDGAVLAAAWGAAGVAGVWLGQKSGKATLEWHGILYLLFLAASSGIAAWCGARFLGKEMGWVSPGLAGWIAAGALLLAYASAGKSATCSGTFWDVHVRPLALAIRSALVCGRTGGCGGHRDLPGGCRRGPHGRHLPDPTHGGVNVSRRRPGLGWKEMAASGAELAGLSVDGLHGLQTSSSGPSGES